MKNKIESLEILRALCALVVFLNHLYSKTDGLPQHLIVNMLLAFATEAVICFFVLSGCVIALQPFTSLWDYAKARLVRIVPIYAFALAMTVLVMLFCGRVVPVDQLLGNVAFLQTMQGHIVVPLPFNLPAWSLSNEVMYYALFPILMCARWLFWLFFGVSVCVGLTLYLFPVPSGVVGYAQIIVAFYSCWLIGFGAARAFQRGGVVFSLGSGAFLFVVGLVLSRVSLSIEYYDFARLFLFSIGVGALCSALLGSEWVGASRSLVVVSMPLTQRMLICACVLFALWSMSRSLMSTRSFFFVCYCCWGHCAVLGGVCCEVYDKASRAIIALRW